MNPRLLALRVLLEVISKGKSLNACTSQINEEIKELNDRSLARELVFGVLRFYHQLLFIVNKFTPKKLKAKDVDIAIILMLGVYQLKYMRVPDHAAVNETVKLVQKQKKNWAKGFVNGVLRSYIREQNSLDDWMATANDAKYSFPAWLLEKIQTDWPGDWQSVVSESNVHAPMVLRVNQQKTDVSTYLKQLAEMGLEGNAMPTSVNAVELVSPCEVTQLPGFDHGVISVQDSAAQQSASLLDLFPHAHVLDACAAPGGKTAHLLETEASIDLLSLDISEPRCDLIKETLARLQLKARVQCANAADVENWWDGRTFDRILLDAPCSATGVIRRNPDIKIHRSREDISSVVENQRNLLEKLWPLLKSKGILLYATCSILKDENENQIIQFLHSHQDAKEVKIDVAWGRGDVGVQVLPGENKMDGFYYAKIQKS